MKTAFLSNKGTTLIEVLVTVVISLVIVTAASSTIMNSQFLASLSKHKLEAMYAAQQVLEQERRLSFANIVSVASTPVILDDNGTFNNPNDDFLGNVIITVTSLDVYRKQVQVQVNWQERLIAGKLTVRENYSTNIANDPVPN